MMMMTMMMMNGDYANDDNLGQELRIIFQKCSTYNKNKCIFSESI